TGLFNNNQIPEPEGPPKPTNNYDDLVKYNEVGRHGETNQGDDKLSNVLMTHAGEDSMFSNTELLA
ncbi:hypothetical protein M9458_014383, partial [Cirrhinus mrigala]